MGGQLAQVVDKAVRDAVTVDAGEVRVLEVRERPSRGVVAERVKVNRPIEASGIVSLGSQVPATFKAEPRGWPGGGSPSRCHYWGTANVVVLANQWELVRAVRTGDALEDAARIRLKEVRAGHRIWRATSTGRALCRTQNSRGLWRHDRCRSDGCCKKGTFGAVPSDRPFDSGLCCDRGTEHYAGWTGDTLRFGTCVRRPALGQNRSGSS